MGPLYCAIVFIFLCYGSALAKPIYLMVAPNILRVENEDTVYLEAQGAIESVPVNIHVFDFPLKRRVLYTTSTTLEDSMMFQRIVKIKLTRRDFQRDQKNHYVYLQATFNEENVLSEILVSFQSGYIFLQTDKPIYNPAENMQYRVFTTDADAKSVSNVVTIQIKNPEGIAVQEDPQVMVKDGIMSKVFKLPDVLIEGTWTLQAQLYSHPEQAPFSTQFEVKKHVLPSFEVTIIPSQKFFNVDEMELTMEVEARYIFDAEVQGSAYMIFGVLRKDGTRKNFQSSLTRKRLNSGKATATLDRKKYLFSVDEKLDDSIYFRAQVITSTGSDIVEAEATVKVVNSPYRISFPKSSKYFKPGLPVSLYVKVVQSDGSPANRVSLKVICDNQETRLNTDSHGMALFSINTGANDLQKFVTVKTADVKMKNYQAQSQIILFPFQTKRVKEYMQLSAEQTSVQLDAPMPIITIHFSRDTTISRPEEQYVSYMVVNKGQIIKAGKWPASSSQKVIKQSLEVTKEMLPSFRLVAYYILPANNEVVSDSLWVDMEDVCQGQLQVSIQKQQAEYSPKSKIKLRVKGDPKAYVGLGIIDKAALTLSNKGFLTQKKIWDAVEDRDIGCTRGGGKDSMDIFTNAGLMFASNAEAVTVPRQSHVCSSDGMITKKRRAATLIEMKLELENLYSDKMLKKCCRDGMTEFPLDYTCEKRSLYITESQECVKAFLRCCNDIKEKKEYYNVHELILSRNSESDFDESSIYVRSKFDVSWKWETIHLIGETGVDGLVTYEEEIPLKDSITEWHLMAISASSSKGVCVVDPLKIMVKKRFFVDLRLPYSVVNKEQVNIKAVLHNYYDDDLTVTVELFKHEFLCSEASAKGRSHKRVNVPKESTKLVEFTIIPLMKGMHAVKVRAFDRTREIGDAIEKELRVVDEGVETFKKTVKILNPSGKGGKQIEEFSLPPLEWQVPGLDPTTIITVLGDELADTLENSLSGNVLSHLIRSPGGCVEQNLASMTSPVISTHYLDTSNAWESVGVQRRTEALSYIKRGYQNQIQYRKSDDSYPPYQDKMSSTWVTAYTVKVFAMASAFTGIDNDRACKPISFLIERQTSDGYFEEKAPVKSQYLQGGTRGKGAPGLTAFVLIAMKEAQEICEGGNQALYNSMKKASDYLLRELPSHSDPYILSIASYALALYGVPKVTILGFLNKASAEFDKAKNDDTLKEAKGYFLLASLKLDDLNMATPVSQWLMEQAGASGQFGSTQSTMVVFQALAQYKLQDKRKPEKKMTVTLSISGRSGKIPYTFTKNNWFVARSEKIHKLKDLTVQAEGSGTGKIVFLTVYNAIPQNEESCESYEMDVQMMPLSLVEAQTKYALFGSSDAVKTYMLTICLRPLPGTPELMTILDISLPTGFVPNWRQLDMLIERVDNLIQNYTFDTELSQRGSLIIHLYRVHQNDQTCVPVILEQEFVVGLLQPAIVTAYSYYNRGKNCTKMYHPAGNSTALGTVCVGDVCKCAEKSCPLVKSDEDRYTIACRTTSHIYKLKLIKAQYGQVHDEYIMQIEGAFKSGKDTAKQGDKRTFISHVSCRESMDLKENHEYLIIGNPDTVLKTPKGEFHYLLSALTWLEPIPTAAECQEGQTATCNAIKDFLDEFELYGCPS